MGGNILKRWGLYGVTAAVVLIAVIFSPLEHAQAAFNKANIVSDAVFFDRNSMSENDIHNFLVSHGSGYASYIIPEYITVAYPTGYHQWGYVSVRQAYDGNPPANFFGKSVARLIWEEAQEHGISPRFMLAQIQKESSGVTENIIDQPRDHWALGYGYPDSTDACYDFGTNCNDPKIRQNAIDYGGVGQQIAYATAQFQRLYGRYLGTDLTVTVSGQTFTCENVPTRVMYAYTPHISGNQNFYTIFTNWFGEPGVNLSYDDTSALDTRTYSASVRISGSKHTDSEVYLGAERIANAGGTTWGKDLSLGVGTYSATLEYKRGGSTVATKAIKIIRHKEGDINGDTRVDLLDLSTLSNNYGQKENADPMANLNPTVDNEINLLDISIFANKWEG